MKVEITPTQVIVRLTFDEAKEIARDNDLQGTSVEPLHDRLFDEYLCANCGDELDSERGCENPDCPESALYEDDEDSGDIVDEDEDAE